MIWAVWRLHDTPTRTAARGRSGRGLHAVRHSRGTAPDTRPVSGLQGRGRQQTRALGQDCRVHEAGRGEFRSRALPRARQDQPEQPVHRARDQRGGHAEESRTLQAARAQAVLPGRCAGRRRARRDLPPGQAGAGRHLQHPCNGDWRVADVRGAGTPARDGRFACGEKDSRQRDLPAGAEPQPGRADHGDRLVQQERRHRVREQPDSLPLSPVRRPRQQPRHVHVHAEGERAHGTAAVARLVPGRVARRASDGQQRRAHLRHAGNRSDQRQRAPAHLSLERHPGAVAGGGLEAAGKEGIIYNATYTNFWEGAMAWSGWWHNQIGLLTEVASARVAAPIDQQKAVPGRPSTGSGQAPAAGGGRGDPSTGSGPGGGGRGQQFSDAPLPPPTDVTSRTEYPRPCLRGTWALRHIVDYELIATMALLDTAADRREAIVRQIYEVNRETIENGKKGNPSAILVPIEHQHDAREAAHLVDRLNMGGVDVYRADAAFDAGGAHYGAGP